MMNALIIVIFNSGNTYEPVFEQHHVDPKFIEDIGYLAYTAAKAHNRGWQTIDRMLIIHENNLINTYDECGILNYLDRIRELRTTRDSPLV